MNKRTMWTEELAKEKVMEVVASIGENRMPSAAEIEEHFGDLALSRYISKNGGIPGYAEKLGLPEGGNPRKRKPEQPPDSICWKCENAVPTKTRGCSWSRDGVYVKGWTLHKFKFDSNKGRVRVIDCPLYIPQGDKIPRMDGENKNFRALGVAVVKDAVTELRHSTYQWLLKKDEYKEAIRRMDEWNKIADFRKKIVSRYGYESIISDLVRNTASKMYNREYWPHKRNWEKAIELRSSMEYCLGFLDSENLLMYGDFDSDYIISETKRQAMEMVKEKREGKGKCKKRKRRTTSESI